MFIFSEHVEGFRFEKRFIKNLDEYVVKNSEAYRENSMISDFWSANTTTFTQYFYEEYDAFKGRVLPQCPTQKKLILQIINDYIARFKMSKMSKSYLNHTTCSIAMMNGKKSEYRKSQ